MDKTVDRELPATPEIQHTSRWPKNDDLEKVAP